MSNYDDLNHKIFLIDYRFLNGDRRIKSYLTCTYSRRMAEQSLRDVVRNERINILKITPIIQDQQYHDSIDEAIASFKEYIDLENEKIRLSYLDTYQ